LRNEAHCIRIVSVPPGEAPLWVREKWVGLQLPLVPGKAKPGSFRTSGVLTGPRNSLSRIWRLIAGQMPRQTGYAVDVDAALQVLDETARRKLRDGGGRTRHGSLRTIGISCSAHPIARRSWPAAVPRGRRGRVTRFCRPPCKMTLADRCACPVTAG